MTTPNRPDSPDQNVPTTALSRGDVSGLPELAARYLEEYLDKIRLALDRLPEDELWWRPAEGTNSAGNLLLHLVGNLSLWILAGVCGEPFERRRSEEFTATGGGSKAELVERLTDTVARCRAVLEAVDPNDLGRPLAVQGYDVDLLGGIFHATEHMSYHTGQIVWLVKQGLGRRDGESRLEFYPRHAGE